MKKIFKTILISLIALLVISLIYLSQNKFIIKKTMSHSDIEYIYLDPGHGGIDGGGVSKTGVHEKEINLNICFYLKDYLQNSGYRVKMTRTGDYDLASKNSKNRKHDDILKRVNLINNNNTVLFISVHCNIYSDSNIHGAQTFYKSNNIESKKLSESIQEKITNILKNTDRKAKSITDKYIIENTNKTGSLVEVGFLSNDKELELLTSKTYQDLIAYCIYIGIIDYLGTTNKI